MEALCEHALLQDFVLGEHGFLLLHSISRVFDVHMLRRYVHMFRSYVHVIRREVHMLRRYVYMFRP